MSNTKPKAVIYENLAELAKALGHAHRLELLEHISQRPRSVEDLSVRAGLTFANASRHLQILRRARLVEARRSGKQVIYGLAGDAEVVGLIRALGVVGERNMAEIQRLQADYFQARDTLEAVSRSEVLDMLRNGLVTILDVRPEDEFTAGHLPQAINIPVGELDERLGEIPLGREVIAYCRGPYCVLSFDAVAVLRKKGMDARRLEDGYPEWKAEGLSVEGGYD